MRTFAYHHWDLEFVFIGDWSAGRTVTEAAELETRLRALHEKLWSSAPPGLHADAAVAEVAALGDLEHPLAGALFLLYHAAAPRFARRDSHQADADRLRRVARRVLQQPPIAHVAAADVPQVLGQVAVSLAAGAYVRWTALAALRDLAQPQDLPLLWARLPRAASAPETAVADAAEENDCIDERVEVVGVLTELVTREPALLASTGLASQLLALVADDRSVPVRIAALQALMAVSPDPSAVAALRSIAGGEGEAEELAWAAALALYRHQPAANAALVLAVDRRSRRPDGFSALFTQLELVAEEAALHIALFRPGGQPPLIWRDPDCTVFALCQADGTAPPGTDDPALTALAAQWVTADPSTRAALLSRLAHCGHVAGRALAILAGPPAKAEPDEFDDCEESDEKEPADLDTATAEPTPTEVDWPALARRVLADPPLNRLGSAEGRGRSDHAASDQTTAGGAAFPTEIGQRAFTHCAAIELLGTLGEPGDGDLLAQYFLLAAEPLREPLRVAALQALYGHSQRRGQPPAGSQLLAAVTGLARDGDGEARRQAVQLLGRFPEAVTGLLLRELAHDPTSTVCCIAERALAEQMVG